ncbi:MAG TPA: RHS repeat-associated core domain-containing protein, partial [Acidimicrobiales bacterium]|nr:RHS repeat-associated core domain-containing protein [Acidimicrobiales bacterium]
GGLPLEQVAPDGTTQWFFHDQLGSTRALTDSSGAVVGTWSYDPYGQVVASSGTATTPLGFAGEWTDAETGFVYLRARYYDPATGQFLTRDPLVATTRSAYGYVGGSPLNGTDATGLWCLVHNSHGGCKGAEVGRQLGAFGHGMLGGDCSYESNEGRMWACSVGHAAAVVEVGIVTIAQTVGCPEESSSAAEAESAGAGGGLLNEAEISVVRGGGTEYTQTNGAVARASNRQTGDSASSSMANEA